jgi:hypothetical protein
VDICNVVLRLGDSLWFRFASHLSRKTREANHVAFGSAAATTGRSDILEPPNVCCLCEAHVAQVRRARCWGTTENAASARCSSQMTGNAAAQSAPIAQKPAGPKCA